MIEYCITPARPTAHQFEVELYISEPDPAGQVLALPAWIPGSYLVRDFARNIVKISAECAGEPVPLTKLDKHAWQAAPVDAPLSLRYTVYAFDESVRSAYLNESRGFFNGTSVFLRVVGQEDASMEVEINPPPGTEGWKVATTLPSAGAAEWAFGRYQAENYAQLIDHPVEMADFDLLEYEAGGVPHAMALTGQHEADKERLAGDLEKICEAQMEMFGGSPLERYLFLTLVKSQSYGGLEHLDSSALICNRGDLPRKGMGKASPEYHRFLGLCSHEYFHLWNVKRIRPPAVSHSDLSEEAYFRDLWAYEGITSYYDELFLLRAGVIQPAAWLEEQGKTLTRVWRTPGRMLQSLNESSFDAWTKFYKQDENAPNAIVSYYAKGAVVALCLDLQLRLDSKGKVSLDDVMRLLWERYGSQGEPVPEHGIEQLVKECAGRDYDEFFTCYVHGREDPPVVELLEAFGIKAKLRARSGMADTGGRAAVVASHAELGVITAQENGREVVKVVMNDSAAENAGIQPGDELVALDNQRLPPGGLDNILNRCKAGQQITLTLFRDDLLHEKTVALKEKPEDTWVLSLDTDADDEAMTRRDQWWHC